VGTVAIKGEANSVGVVLLKEVFGVVEGQFKTRMSNLIGSVSSPQSGEMFIDKWPKRTSSLRRSEMWLSKLSVSLLRARIKFFYRLAYRHLAPNGAKTFSFVMSNPNALPSARRAA
jgi:hypothetical protein